MIPSVCQTVLKLNEPGKIKSDLISLETSKNDFTCYTNVEGFISEVIVTLKYKLQSNYRCLKI